MYPIFSGYKGKTNFELFYYEGQKENGAILVSGEW
jgi:hypothetical protein